MLSRGKRSSLFSLSVIDKGKKVFNTDTSSRNKGTTHPDDNAKVQRSLAVCGQFHKLFTGVTYSPSKISCTVHCMQAPMQYF
jgi:hypothetical protein